MTPEQFGQFIRAESAKYKDFAKRTGRTSGAVIFTKRRNEKSMSTFTRRELLRVIGAAACAGLAPSRAWAAWPEKPVTLVVGYAPGGGSDTSARTVSSRMSAKLGQPVIVENRPGSAGQIAAGYVARSAADGYTALIDASSFAINLAIYPAFRIRRSPLQSSASSHSSRLSSWPTPNSRRTP